MRERDSDRRREGGKVIGWEGREGERKVKREGERGRLIVGERERERVREKERLWRERINTV